MRIITREEWGAVHDDGFGPAPLPAEELWLHHSVTAARDGASSVRLLESIGEQRFGRGISYTFVITPDGTVYEGHGVDRQGAHTKGRNSIARAICLIGDYSRYDVPSAMVGSIVDLVRVGHDAGWWQHACLNGGHCDAPGAQTACPGQYAYAQIPIINQRLAPIVPSTRGRDNVLENHRLRGSGVIRLNFPVGAAVISRGWLSAGADGPNPAYVKWWAQTPSKGLSEGTWTIRHSSGRSEQPFVEVPNGTTSINIHYDFPDGGVITLEGLSR